MRPFGAIVLGITTLTALSSCGKSSTTRPTWMIESSCQTLPAASDRVDSIKVVLLDPVEPRHAPWGQNPSEQLVFHHLYETLITVDCVGEVRPGLASSWSSSRSGWVWTFELRDGARFWDGTRVTAGDVVTGWQDAITLETNIDSVATDGERRIRVYLKRRQRDVPRDLSAPVFALARLEPGRRWPLGSGPYRIVGQGGGMIVVRPAFGRRYPVIEFDDRRADDRRDALEGSVDMMVTGDPTVTEYAAGRDEFTTIALPWERTYILLGTERVRAMAAGRRVRALSPEIKQGLARDAVRGDARGFEPPVWWDEMGPCPNTPTGELAPPSMVSSRILYDANDSIASDLAGRLVALASRDPATSSEAAALAVAFPSLVETPGVTAVGVSREELGRRLRMGDALAYVLSLPRQTAVPCFELGQLYGSAPWLDGADLGEALVPLVDTRSYVIARSDRFGLITDLYGQTLIINEK